MPQFIRDTNEWVVVLRGRAGVRFEDESELRVSWSYHWPGDVACSVETMRSNRMRPASTGPSTRSTARSAPQHPLLGQEGLGLLELGPLAIGCPGQRHELAVVLPGALLVAG